ncbi:hypothetical protein V1477_006038, partial [Vespula maculifrons]
MKQYTSNSHHLILNFMGFNDDDDDDGDDDGDDDDDNDDDDDDIRIYKYKYLFTLNRPTIKSGPCTFPETIQLHIHASIVLMVPSM